MFYYVCSLFRNCFANTYISNFSKNDNDNNFNLMAITMMIIIIIMMAMEITMTVVLIMLQVVPSAGICCYYDAVMQQRFLE